MSEWMPIETAPKDRRILLVLDNNVITIGAWNPDEFSVRPRPYWSTDWGLPRGKIESRLRQPTLWMPLPEPPK